MKQRHPFLITMAVVAIVAAIWSYVFLTTPPQQTLDQRVHTVALQLKCPICQGESVADSPSLLAQQMRGVIRQQLQSGKSEQEVIQYFEARYGAQIVWSPPWQGFTILAWLVPIGLLLVGTILLFSILWHWRTLSPNTLASFDTEPADIDETDLARYHPQLMRELADEDALFRTEVL